MPKKPVVTEEGMVSKITIRGIGCAPIGSPTPTPLLQVFGRATGVKTGFYDKDDPEQGEWEALAGEFMAVNLQDDKNPTFRSARLHLPSGIDTPYLVAVREMQKAADEAVKAGKPRPELEVVFALELRSIKAANKSGFSYIAIDLMPPKQEQDYLSRMRSQVTAELERRELAAGSTETRQLESGKEHAGAGKGRSR